jgi:exopolysaccharide biosynthesis polyprenyl glycosylphosphotransferase
MNGNTGKPGTLTGGFALSGFGRSVASDQVLRPVYLVTLLVADVVMLGAAFRIAFWVRFRLKLTTAPDIVPSFEFYTKVALGMVVVCVLLFALAGLYRWNVLAGGTAEYSRVFNSSTVGILFVVLATFVYPAFVVSRLWLAASWFSGVFMACASRFALRRMVYALRERGYFLVRAAIAGTNGEALALARELRQPRSGYEVVGLIGIGWGAPSPDSPGEPGLPMLGTIKDLEALVRRLGIKELVVSASSLHREELFALYGQVHSIPGLELRLSTGLFELLTTGVEVRTAGVVPLICLKKIRLDTSELIVKTCAELALTTVGLVLLLPVMALIALAIKYDSPGPLIYRRRVLGVGGKEFYAYKFRTMRVDGDKILDQHPELASRLKENEKLQDDPRVTRIGEWLRRYSLDELPQLLNVLMLQMSLVGPRMISPPEAEKYGQNRYNLLTVKPGITGLWQVSGRSDLSYQERVRLDMYYVRNYSLWLDFHILFVRTADAVLRGRGAY